ncbi:MAG: cation transporter [Candidatus Omnitrophica bacterium]|nr:cation transporter [Candidatus Omnitrophota bacterium]
MRKKDKDLYNPKTCIQISILVNILLTGFKFLAGIFGLSQAMIADAFHSLSDILTSVVVYVGVHIGAMPPDEDHPYGHGNAETIAASVVSLIILGIGAFAGIEALLAIIKGDFKVPLNLALSAAVVSIVVKEALFRYSIKVGQVNNNPAIIADAWHHRSDALSSVAAFFGILGAKASFLLLDPLAGIVVAMLIVKIGIELMRTNVGIIMDERPQIEFIENICVYAREVEGVKKIDDVKVHRRGSSFTVDLEISVDSSITVSEGHNIAAQVRKKLLRSQKSISNVMVHVNPHRSRHKD